MTTEGFVEQYVTGGLNGYLDASLWGIMMDETSTAWAAQSPDWQRGYRAGYEAAKKALDKAKKKE